MKSISTIAMLLLAAATNVIAAQARPGDQSPTGGGNAYGQVKQAPHRIATPLLARSPFETSRAFVCRAVNVADEPVTVTVRMFTNEGEELDTDDPLYPENPSGGASCRSHELEPRHGCSRGSSYGTDAAFCLITYVGPEGAVRGSLQLGYDGEIVAAQ